MTFSICATDGKVHGAAVATKSLTVGSLVPFVSKNGAVCTQSFVSVPLGVKTSRLLDNDSSIDHAIETLLDKDLDPSRRQIHGVDTWGNSHIHSGNNCSGWFGGIDKKKYTIAGNMLTGEKVIQEMAKAFESSDEDEPMENRLMKTIRAGEDAGGDKRRETAQSAALKIYHPKNPKIQHDLRVDEHDKAVSELERILDEAVKAQKEAEEEYQNLDIKFQRYP